VLSIRKKFLVDYWVSLLGIHENITIPYHSAVKICTHRGIIGTISIPPSFIEMSLLTGEEKYNFVSRHLQSAHSLARPTEVLSTWFSAPSGNCPCHSHNRGAQSEHEKEREEDREKGRKSCKGQGANNLDSN